MVYLLYGPNDFSLKDRILDIINRRDVISISTDDALVAQAGVGVQDGLFGEPSVIYVHDVISAITPEWLENQGHDVVISAGAKVDKRTAMYKWVLKYGVVEEFVEKDKGQMFAWANKNYDVEPIILQTLWERHGANLWIWYQELEKLQAYAGYGERIQESHERLISERSVEENIFTFLDTFSNKSPAAPQQYVETLGIGIDEYYLLSMLSRQIRLLLLAGESDGLKGQHPFVIQKTTQQAKRWDHEELVSAHNALVQIDFDSKTGNDLDSDLLAFVIRYTD